LIIVDSNVLFDAADPESPNHQWARDVIRSNRGSMGLNQIVYAELLHAQDAKILNPLLGGLQITLLDLPWEACPIAARAFSQFLKRTTGRGEKVRSIPLPDFFIGAHAEAEGFSVATSDRKWFKSYFPTVKLVD
jgi:predicted nucleic acid-binding protein